MLIAPGDGRQFSKPCGTARKRFTEDPLIAVASSAIRNASLPELAMRTVLREYHAGTTRTEAARFIEPHRGSANGPRLLDARNCQARLPYTARISAASPGRSTCSGLE